MYELLNEKWEVNQTDSIKTQTILQKYTNSLKHTICDNSIRHNAPPFQKEKQWLNCFFKNEAHTKTQQNQSVQNTYTAEKNRDFKEQTGQQQHVTKDRQTDSRNQEGAAPQKRTPEEKVTNA